MDKIFHGFQAVIFHVDGIHSQIGMRHLDAKACYLHFLLIASYL